jgi:hypothetical protein
LICWREVVLASNLPSTAAKPRLNISELPFEFRSHGSELLQHFIHPVVQGADPI